MSGPVAVFECKQRIPCNPCAEACPRGAIQPFQDINDCPTLNPAVCNGCGFCLTRCPGLSIFIIDDTYSSTEALLKIPYEFNPLPEVGETVNAVNREGSTVGAAVVVKVQRSKNKTSVISVTVPKGLVSEVRNIQRQGRQSGE